MTHFEIVKKLIGEVRPLGQSHIDSQRYLSLRELCKLTEELIAEIETVAECANGHSEFSIVNASKYAKNFLKVIKNEKD